MLFEERGGVLERLIQKRELLRAGDPAHKKFRPLLLVLSGLMRGVYGAGQALGLAKLDLTHVFDTAVGVSTGAPVIAYLLAEQVEKGASIYTNECLNKTFLCKRRLVGPDPIMNIDYLAEVFRGNTPRGVGLDTARLRESRTHFYTAVTEESSGTGVLLDAKSGGQDPVEALRASVAAPGISHGKVRINDTYYLDGEGAFPFPAQEVIERFDPTEILVLANRPKDDPRPAIERALTGRFLEKISAPARSVFSTKEARFEEGLAFLSNQSRPYGVIWTDNLVNTMEQNREKLLGAVSRAEKHLTGLFQNVSMFAK